MVIDIKSGFTCYEFQSLVLGRYISKDQFDLHLDLRIALETGSRPFLKHNCSNIWAKTLQTKTFDLNWNLNYSRAYRINLHT